MSRRSEIEAQARALLRDHGMLGLSVDPVRLANASGVRVFNAKFGMPNTHGLLAVRSGKASVYVEVDDAPNRKRFTIAHELGHYILHYGDRDIEHIDTADSFRTVLEPDLTWTEERRKEWEANVFAASLLMESESVRKKWDEIGDIDGMAAWFQVSTQAMAIRLSELGISS